MFAWIGNLWRKIVGTLKRTLATIFHLGLRTFYNEFWDFIVTIIDKLNKADLSDPEKHKKAFNLIAKEVKDKGKFYRDNWINILIPMAVEFVKFRYG